MYSWQEKDGPWKPLFKAARDGIWWNQSIKELIDQVTFKSLNSDFMAGNVQRAKNEIRNGIDVNIKGYEGLTALHVATEYGASNWHNFSRWDPKFII